ncbi:MAG: alpha/beta hydrolase [Ignavibacteriales bacterium]|nr:alpha/beta hydrolase [Ignavibacteriales bacterium]
MKHRSLVLSILCFLFFSWNTSEVRSQGTDSWTSNAVNGYRITPNVIYSTANGYDCKLDVYARNNPGVTTPTVIFIHGGGWVGGTKEGTVMNLMPYFEMGLNVVNVEYRLARVSLAPAAVQDCRLALRWIFKNAKQYGFDTTKIIVSGGSAGGHLALTTGMLDASYGFDYPTDWDYTGVEPKVAAIVNWYGITDVKDLLAGPNKQDYAVDWLANLPNKEAVAVSVSPLSYVRKGLPPVFTVHGDKDQLVPYNHAVRLHDALTKAGVPNQLMTIPGGKHGGFSKEEMGRIYTAIKEFLKKNKIVE